MPLILFVHTKMKIPYNTKSPKVMVTKINVCHTMIKLNSEGTTGMLLVLACVLLGCPLLFSLSVHHELH